MAINDDLATYVAKTFKSQWTSREGRKVPTEADVQLGNDSIKLDAVCLYADMAKSTQLVDNFSPNFAAEIYKTFLFCASKLIKHYGGEITAFDGDRVMGVFIGDYKNTNAARCGLHINSAVYNIINPLMKSQYPSINYQVTHAVGIDASPLMISRIGYRGSNDLTWMGKAGNYAAKLCALREGQYATWITETVYKNMIDDAKFYNGTNMWVQNQWHEKNIIVYGSSWWRYWP